MKPANSNYEFIELIREALPREQIAQLEAIEDLATLYQYIDHYAVLQGMLSDTLDLPEVSAPDHCYGTYLKTLKQLIGMHDILLSDFELTVDELIEMLDALYSLTQTFNSDLVDKIATKEEQPEAIIAELLGELTSRGMPHWYAAIAEVEPALITAILKLSTNEDILEEISEKQAELTGKLREWYPKLPTEIIDSFKGELVELPVPLKSILRKPAFSESKDPREIAGGLIHAYIISGRLNKEEILLDAIDVVDTYFDDVLIPGINSQLTMLMKQGGEDEL